MHTGWRRPFNCVPELRKFIIYTRSVPFTVKRPRKPETDIKDSFEEMEQITAWNIPSRKTGLHFTFRCSRKFSTAIRVQFTFKPNFPQTFFFNEKQPLTLVSSSMFLFSSSTVWSWPFFAFVRLPNLDSLSSSLDPRSATSLSRRELTTDKSPTCFFKSSTYESNN